MKTTRSIRFHQYIDENHILEYLDNNFGEIAKSWFNLQIQWTHNAYQAFRDLEKYIIFLYLIKKTLNFYSENLIFFDFKTYFKDKEIEIPKFNIIEISKSLNISKETTRRKILELENLNILRREKKKLITINFLNKSFFKYPLGNIKIITKFLYDFSNALSKKKIIKKKIDTKIIESYLLENFTYSWSLFLNMQIPFMMNWKNVFGDFETWYIFGQCCSNIDISLKKIKKTDKKYKEKIFYINKSIGINAMSIAELSTIPRATVVRKLKKLLEMNALYIDKKKLYHPKYLEDEAHSTFSKQRKLVAIFSTKIYNSIIEKNFL
jgi:predicted transcriptional regulator